MNILDENIPESQSAFLRDWRVAFRQIGKHIGRKGMQDNEIIRLLQELSRPTFFTLDDDFYDRRLRHGAYCLAYLDVEEELAADYIRRLLRHRELNTKAKRMGCVIRASSNGIAAWRANQREESQFSWK